jgi:hypothetical protein
MASLGRPGSLRIVPEYIERQARLEMNDTAEIAALVNGPLCALSWRSEVRDGPQIECARARERSSTGLNTGHLVPLMGLSVSSDSSLHDKTGSKSAICTSDGQLAR